MGAIFAGLIWLGYTMEYFGWYYAQGAPIKIVDTVLPSHRQTLAAQVKQTFAAQTTAPKGKGLTPAQALSGANLLPNSPAGHGLGGLTAIKKGANAIRKAIIGS